MKAFLRVSIPAILFAAAASAPAAQLSTDARTAIPHDVQQLVAIDYHAMENSPSAMDLRERVMPPELKRFEEALQQVRTERKPRCRIVGLCPLPSQD